MRRTGWSEFYVVVANGFVSLRDRFVSGGNAMWCFGGQENSRIENDVRECIIFI